ncbi:MAG: acyl-CoA dehydrogenase C-terminal domain-containing protein [Actinomycetales bacterium]|nr:acyl-CoA dehydrogenase C-terminal domain-containing protein [Actinomycetales bacterium]
MKSRIMSEQDLAFLLYEWLDVEALTSRPRYREHSRETFDAVMELSRELAEQDFAPHNRLGDTHEPHFDGTDVHVIPEVAKALAAFAESGLMAATLDAEVGGGQLPQVVGRAASTWLQAANIATITYPALSVANANLLLAHGSAEQVERFVRPIIEGRFFGTMCLSEPQAGSSLADVVTRAVLQEDGTYRLFGSKMWISAGDHDLSENIVHLVLARTPGAPPGVKGLSLFIVPKFLVNDDGSCGERNDVVLAGVNHKMGYRGTVNTILNFGEGTYQPGGGQGAIGTLVGEEHHGLAYMFHMMNEARVGVGAAAVALGYTGYLHALDYARNRPQGRPAWDKDPSSPQVPIIRHADVRRMLLASKSYVEGALALVLFAALLLDEQLTAETSDARDEAALLLDVLTPIVKAWPSQWCLKANDYAIQVHGGYGYTREYPVEQFYRDNRLNAIHEGTDGIQAIDLLGRKVVMQSGAGLRALHGRISATCARADGDLAAYGQALQDAINRIGGVTMALWADRDPRIALSNSSLYADALGHVVIAWMWLEQMQACAGKSGAFYDGKRAAGAYFFDFELPRIGPTLDLLQRCDTTFSDLDDACL